MKKRLIFFILAVLLFAFAGCSERRDSREIMLREINEKGFDIYFVCLGSAVKEEDLPENVALRRTFDEAKYRNKRFRAVVVTDSYIISQQIEEIDKIKEHARKDSFDIYFYSGNRALVEMFLSKYGAGFGELAAAQSYLIHLRASGEREGVVFSYTGFNRILGQTDVLINCLHDVLRNRE